MIVWVFTPDGHEPGRAITGFKVYKMQKCNTSLGAKTSEIGVAIGKKDWLN
ncbi:MAG: hypothetical protein ABIY62_08000 [Ginsengibacter sp.]